LKETHSRTYSKLENHLKENRRKLDELEEALRNPKKENQNYHMQEIVEEATKEETRTRPTSTLPKNLLTNTETKRPRSATATKQEKKFGKIPVVKLYQIWQKQQELVDATATTKIVTDIEAKRLINIHNQRIT